MWYRGDYSTDPGIQAALGAGASLYDQQPEAPPAVRHALAERLLLVFPDAKPSIIYAAVSIGWVRARARR
jgi:hypothetical protein